MAWSEVQKGKEVVRRIVAEIDDSVVCDIAEPVGEDFDRDLYPVRLTTARQKIQLKISMEDLEDITEDKSVQRKIRQRLERLIKRAA